MRRTAKEGSSLGKSPQPTSQEQGPRGRILEGKRVQVECGELRDAESTREERQTGLGDSEKGSQLEERRAHNLKREGNTSKACGIRARGGADRNARRTSPSLRYPFPTLAAQGSSYGSIRPPRIASLAGRNKGVPPTPTRDNSIKSRLRTTPRRAPDVDAALLTGGEHRSPGANQRTRDAPSPHAPERRRHGAVGALTLLVRRGDSGTARGGGHAVCAAGPHSRGRTRRRRGSEGAIAQMEGGRAPVLAVRRAAPGALTRGRDASRRHRGGAALQTRPIRGELRDRCTPSAQPWPSHPDIRAASACSAVRAAAARAGSSAPKSAGRAHKPEGKAWYRAAVRISVQLRRGRAGAHGASNSSFTRSSAGGGTAACAPRTLRAQDAPRGGTPDRVRGAECAGAHHLRGAALIHAGECRRNAPARLAQPVIHIPQHEERNGEKLGRRSAGIARSGEVRTYGPWALPWRERSAGLPRVVCWFPHWHVTHIARDGGKGTLFAQREGSQSRTRSVFGGHGAPSTRASVKVHVGL
ncbi:hypothetical protein FB451DRAFT_1178874 [Mycena latifolia]|nr:hypothetical protein FB451DRAFT_1178874 [Mycena latifolia]